MSGDAATTAEAGYTFTYGGVRNAKGRAVPTNLPGQEKVIDRVETFLGSPPRLPCGPAVRLTPSKARQAGAMWYARQMNVREGFDTTFVFRIANPSTACDVMADVFTYCRSRGADGLAFVVQNEGNTALGATGSGLGYAGISNSLAVEFDTYHNPDVADVYENHISVQTRGFRQENDAHHFHSLAMTARIADLTTSQHAARIRYIPYVDEDMVFHPSFQATGHSAEFLTNRYFQLGGVGDWGRGLGMLFVYFDDLDSPVITTFVDVASTLALNNSRAYVGFTAATGDAHWQAHDLLSWSFSSLYEEPPLYTPLVINGEGALLPDSFFEEAGSGD